MPVVTTYNRIYNLYSILKIQRFQNLPAATKNALLFSDNLKIINCGKNLQTIIIEIFFFYMSFADVPNS